MPCGFNYVDDSLYITHDEDSKGDHGSHVTGIAAGNRYVPDGKGGYANALDTVSTQGVAPDAQVLVMKVFGKGGGAYDSDYMVAIDAHRGESYSFDLFLAPLSKVANVEKKFPLEWIVDGNKIDDRFFDYAMPLMMDKAPDYAILR